MLCRPLACETSAGGAPKGVKLPVYTGFGGSRRLCSRTANDCRSQQAARGPSRPQVKSLCNRIESSSSVREHWRGESASEAGSTVAKPWARWRALLHRMRGNAKAFRILRRQNRALVDGRRSGSGKLLLLTWEWWKRPWISAIRVWFTRRASGDRQRASEVSGPGPFRLNTPQWVGAAKIEPNAKGGARLNHNRGETRARDQSWRGAVKRISTRSWVAVLAVWRRASSDSLALAFGPARRWSLQRTLRVRESSGSWVLVLLYWLQTSVRRIFPIFAR